MCWGLFVLLYMKDLQTVIEESQVTMFVDDTSLLYSGEKASVYYKQMLRVSNWFIGNKLTVNVSKCELISFGIGVSQVPHLSEKPSNR